MVHPLELSYNWRTPVAVATIGLVACVALLARSRVDGWPSVAVILGLSWLIFLAVVWLRTRAYLMVDGPILRVRRYQHFHDLDGRSIRKVTQFLTPSGPSYKVFVAKPDGATARHVVPCALLRQGHSTLFEWILAWAPDAELDKGSRKTMEQLRIRGLIQ